MMPALTSSSLNAPISVSIFASGITPASLFLSALTRTMTRIGISFSTCDVRRATSGAVRTMLRAVVLCYVPELP